MQWKRATVFFTPMHLAAHASDAAILQRLCDAGLLDYSLWAPPCRDASALKLRTLAQAPIFEDVTQAALAAVVQAEVSTRGMRLRASRHFSAHPDSGGDAAHTGIGQRLTDGLVGGAAQAPRHFFAPGYRSPVGTLPFCGALPHNSLGLAFPLRSVLDMCGDALMKLHEMRRQRSSLSPRHAVAVYVYTYELTAAEEPLDQIYAAMNAAMRTGDGSAITYWRPLIWEIDVALAALPSYSGLLYRGINRVFDRSAYRMGQCVRWHAFSSSSQSRTVAEEFAQGQEGTLFFLQSTSGKCIAAVSRFPHEQVPVPRAVPGGRTSGGSGGGGGDGLRRCPFDTPGRAFCVAGPLVLSARSWLC